MRVAIDLAGGLEPLANSMDELADALDASGLDLVRFRTEGALRPGDDVLKRRRLTTSGWRHGRGPLLERVLPPVDVVHVAGAALPRTKTSRVVVSLDDLRPLRRHAHGTRHRSLQRVITRGAIIVTPTKTAAVELLDLVGIAPSHVRAISPVVPTLAPSLGGVDLVVAVTGSFERFSAIAPTLVNVARARGGRVVLLASTAVAQRSKQLDGVVVRPRQEARTALAQARVALQLSDDARFPSFAIAAAGAGVPTIVRSTPLTREILSGAAALVDSDDVMAEVVDALWRTETQRTILVAAGRVRAHDFSAAAVATDYATLYRSLV